MMYALYYILSLYIYISEQSSYIIYIYIYINTWTYMLLCYNALLTPNSSRISRTLQKGFSLVLLLDGVQCHVTHDMCNMASIHNCNEKQARLEIKLISNSPTHYRQVLIEEK